MDDFTPAELQQFIADLQRPSDGTPSLGTRYARESGYISKFIQFFDPFEYETELRGLAGRLPWPGDLLAVIYPKNRYAIRFYSFRDRGESVIPFARKDLKRHSVSHPGFKGIQDADVELEYQQDPSARQKFEKALALTSVTALYRVLRTRTGRLYFMEKGWSNAYLLSAGLDLFDSVAAGASL